jgi:hypothetical protein
MVGGQGLEPRLADPEPAVLPLDDPPIVLVPPEGIEPPTSCLKDSGSTIALQRRRCRVVRCVFVCSFFPFPFHQWERMDSNHHSLKAFDLQSSGLANAQHSQTQKNHRGLCPGWLRCRYLLWFYGEATLVSESFARAWRVVYFGDSRTTLVPRHDAKIPLSHELLLVPIGECV